MIGKDVHSSQIHERRKRAGRFAKILSAIFLIVVSCIAFAWLVVRSPIFKVKAITVLGNSEVSTSDVLGLARANIAERSALGRLTGFRSYFSWPAELDEARLKLIPKLKSVTIEKSIGDRSVTLLVEEREQYGIWCYQRHEPPECLWFDDEGILFEKSLAVEGNLIHAVNDYSDATPQLRASVLPSAFVSHLFSIFDVVRESRLNVAEIRFENVDLEELTVVTEKAPDLYFSLRFPPTGAREVIESLREKKELSKLQYVDFRVENRAYYK